MEKYKNIPESLKLMEQWVGFCLAYNPEKEKYDKVPINPKGKWGAKSNDPTTWSNFQTAVNAIGEIASFYVERKDSAGEKIRIKLNQSIDGIGFEFANGIYGVDLDHVIIDGQFTQEAQDIIDILDSYTEFSPSGTGAHILCKGDIPDGARKTGNVEIYKAGRFFTVTGDIIGENKEVQERTAQAKIIHAKYLAKPESTGYTTYQPQELTLTDSELINKACNAKNGPLFKSLWNGDTTNHGDDDSRADLALCSLLAYWTNGNGYRMDTLFKQSGLMRNKWNEKHGAATYGNMTIKKVLDDFTPYQAPDYSIQQKEKTAPSAATPETANSIESEIPLYQNEPIQQINFDKNTVSDYFNNHMMDDLKNFKKYKDRKTGFDNLDAMAGGLYPGLYVLGAISSLGKTTFIHQMGDQLAEQGDHVLFFSLEQNVLEMVTKSISRIMAQKNIDKAVSAIDLKRYNLTPEAMEAIEQYSKLGDLISIIPCNFDTNINFIINYTNAYMKKYNVKPVVIVDYLQIIPPTDPRQSDKEKVDNIVRGLKKLQSDNQLVVMVVSSINRTNYLMPIDFESFKESGGIEYTADVVWGLSLQCLNDPIFDKKEGIKEKREKVKKAKAANPRIIELVCLKNRYGISNYTCGFNYNPCYDLFEPNYEQEYSINWEH